MPRRFRMPSRLPKTWLGLVVFILLAVLSIAEGRGWLDDAANLAEQSQPGLYTVTRFSDGDTIVVNMQGTDQTIRMIGVDTPETRKPNAPVQCYGPAASAYTKNLIGSQKVRLQSDELSTNKDRYDRFLRYVYLADGTFVNKKLIENGYGFYYPYFPFTLSEEFAAAQQTAMQSNKGLWGNCNPKQTDRGGYISNDI